MANEGFDSYEFAYARLANPSFRMMKYGEYRQLYDYEYSEQEVKKEQFIGNPGFRACRFCKRYSDSTSFKKLAHVIPASLGNRYLFTHEECDECNQSSGQHEDSFAKVVQVPRALGNSRTGSQAHSKYKTNYGSTIESGVGGTNRQVNYRPGDPQMKVEQFEDGTLRIYAESQKLNHKNTGKALARLALHVMPENHLHKLDHLRQWVIGNSEVVFPFFYYIAPVEGQMRKTRLTLYKRERNDEGLAPFLLVFTYKVLIFVMPIPNYRFEVKQAVIPDLELYGERQVSYVACNYNIIGEAKYQIDF